MITKEEIETFYKLSEKLAKEIKRVALKYNEAYEGNTLKDKKDIEIIDIAMNMPNRIDYTLSSRYIKDDLFDKRAVDTKDLTIPDEKFNKRIDKEVAKMSKERHEYLIKETQEKALYLKLKQKYENNV